jgi:hypothetical protein
VMQHHSLEEAADDSRGRKAVVKGNPIIEPRRVRHRIQLRRNWIFMNQTIENN